MMRILAVLAVLFAAAPALAQQGLPAGADPQNTLIIDTTQGRIVVKLRNDIAPKHAERLKQLARDKFYDNVPFHRVIAGFMAQTGDGQHGNGTGGSKYPDLPAEFSNVPYKRGVVGMARTSDPNSANSQFFIMFADGSFLNNKYTVVGEVLSGMDVVDKLKKGEGQSGSVTAPDKMTSVRVAADVK
jgi:peptidylprolyl isomerase